MEPKPAPRLSEKDRTKAFARYARRHGYYVRTVRYMTSLRREAIREWMERGKVAR